MERLELAIEATDLSTPVFDKVRSGLSAIESIAISAGRKAGAGIEFLEAALRKTADATSHLVEIGRNVSALASGYAAATLAATVHASAVGGVENAYRILRIALSPTIFTAVTIAVIAATEASLRYAYGLGAIAEKQAVLSASSGLSIQQLQEFDQVAKYTGVSADLLQQAVGELAKSTEDLANNQGAANALEKLGISTAKTNVSLQNSPLLLREISTRIETIKDPVDRARISFALFGNDVGGKILPNLNRSLDESIEAANQYGAVLSDTDAKAMVRFKQGIDSMKESLQGLKSELAASVEGLKTFFANAAVKTTFAIGDGFSAINRAVESQSPGGLSSLASTVRQTPEQIAQQREQSRLNALSPENLKAYFLGLPRRGAPSFSDQPELVAAYNSASSAASKLIENYEKSVDGVTAKLSNLKRVREQAIPFITPGTPQFEAITPAQQLNFRSGFIENSRAINETETRLKLLNEKPSGEVAAAEKKAHDQLIEAQKGEYAGLAKIIDQYQIYRREIGLSAKANEDLAAALRIRLATEANKELRKNATEVIKGIEEDFAQQNKFNSERFKAGLEFGSGTADRSFVGIDKQSALQADAITASRDQQLRALDTIQSVTVQQKQAVEAQKLAIEQDYFLKASAFEAEQLSVRQERELSIARVTNTQLLSEKKITEAQANSRLDAITQDYGAQAQKVQQDYLQNVARAQQDAAIRQVQIQQDANRKIFDDFKRSSEGIIDAFVTKGKDGFAALGSFFKLTILTAIKDALSSQVAARLTGAFTGQSVSLQAANPGTGILGRLGGLLGVGAVPSFGGQGSASQQTVQLQQAGVGPGGIPFFGQGNPLASLQSVVGGPGGTGGFAGPVQSVSGGSATPASPFAKLGNLAGLRGLLFNSGSISLGAGSATTAAGIGGLGGTLAGIASSPAAGLAGLGAVLGGFKLGSPLGAVLSTAGGALSGFAAGAAFGSVGGPLGAAIGAGVGALVGIIGLLREKPEDRVKKRVKQTYGVDISKDFALYIDQLAKSQFGGQLDYAIRQPQIRDMIQQYADQTSQRANGIPLGARPTTISSGGSGLSIAPDYRNGSVINTPSIVSGGLGGLTAAGTQGAGPIYLQVTVDGQGAGDYFDGRAVQVVQNSGPAVSASASRGLAASSARNDVRSQILSPGSITR